MSQPKKILLVQLYSNGDCLYATAVAKQIKQDFPGCHLTWAIASFCKNIIANNPYVDAVMEVTTVKKNDVAAFRKFRREVNVWKKNGEFDEVFITHNMDRNHAYYDGCIRSSIFRAYPRKISVDITPVLRLTKEELDRVKNFVETHQISTYKNVVLFEFSPLSGQLNITQQMAMRIAEFIAGANDSAVILSSAKKVDHPNKAIIDGSALSLRETAEVTHYCTLILGCSSGITWISTSEAAKPLPMIQLLNPYTTWVNPISRDFTRFGLDVEKVIEILDLDTKKIESCLSQAMIDFSEARKKYNEPIPLHFKTTRSIVYNLLCYLEFGAILKHIKVNTSLYGHRFDFYKELVMGFITAPFILIRNIFRKHLIKRVK